MTDKPGDAKMRETRALLEFREHLPTRIAAMGDGYRIYLLKALLKAAVAFAVAFVFLTCAMTHTDWDWRLLQVAVRAAGVGLLIRLCLEIRPRDVEMRDDRILVQSCGGIYRLRIPASDIRQVAITDLAAGRIRVELSLAGRARPLQLGADSATGIRLERILREYDEWKGKRTKAALANSLQSAAGANLRETVTPIAEAVPEPGRPGTLDYSTELDADAAKLDWSDFVFPSSRLTGRVLNSIAGERTSIPSTEATGGHWLTPRRAILAAAVMWGLSLALPVWFTRSDHGNCMTVPGVLPAMIGFLGLLAGCPAWFANLVLAGIGFMMFLGRLASFWLAVTAFCIAATAYFMPAVYGDNETAYIVGHRIGFYLWLGSFFVVVLAHAPRQDQEARGTIVVRWVTVLVLLAGVGGLEYRFARSLSPFEAALIAPDNLELFDEVLARSPSQGHKDAALRWVIQQDVAKPHGALRFQRLEKLIAAGANVNSKYEYRMSPLLQAVELPDNEDLVRLLIRAGADVNAGYYEQTVLDIAIQCDASPQCRQILEDAGAKTYQDRK